MPHEGHLAGNRQLGRGGRVRLDEVGLPSDDNELEARVVELAQRLKEQGKPLRPKCPSAAKTMSASSRPRLERTARRSKPSDRRILSRSTARARAMAWRRWSSQQSQSRTVLRLAVSFGRNAP
jgi:hypothetical protein